MGSWLRQQREARGISLLEIAEASKIGRRYLEALESDRWDLLPAPVFTKGFLREYSRIVGLDENEAINLYLLATEALPGQSSGAKVSPETPQQRPWALLDRIGYGWVLFAALAVFLALVFWLGGRSEGQRDLRPELLDPSSPPDRDFPAISQSNSASPSAESPQISTSGVSGSQSPLNIQLTFSGDCWVEAIVDGKRRLAELKISGETLEFVAESRIELTLGNRDAAALFLNGKPHELPRPPSRILRGFVLEAPKAPAVVNQGS